MSHYKRVTLTFKNRGLNDVPINTLPPELLARIFRLACGNEHCMLWHFHCMPLSNPLPNPPDLFLRVCSYWRSVALGSHGLWDHIDLVPFSRLNEQSVRCGRLFAARAGRLPLQLHARISREDIDGCEQELVELCTTIAPRAHSFELGDHNSYAQLRVPEHKVVQILSILFANFKPGKLSRLVINKIYTHGEDFERFIIAHDLERLPVSQANAWAFSLPHRHLEAVLSGVTVLRVSLICPYWTSRAYHGLVKLHLNAPFSSLITISHFAGILGASPQLRYLHFGTAITETCQPEPVHLDELEVLHLDFFHLSQLESVLRLIIPGSNPLRMSTKFQLADMELPLARVLTEGEHCRFFSRSNVVQLDAILHQNDAFVPVRLFELLRLVPYLQVLRLECFYIQGSHTDSIDIEPPPNSQPLELHLTPCSISLRALRQLATASSLSKLTISETSYAFDDGDERFYDLKERVHELVRIFPGVEFINGDVVLGGENWD